ncbi:MAG TPA: hypothetical protein VMM78_09995 [Thermomicrobiales bacterium]|nr:hypothetical protein [Thermomicrobiales bacterium]
MANVANVVTYTVRAEHADELTERVRKHLVPAASKVDGYRGFLLLDQCDRKRMAVLLFESVEQAQAAQQALTPVGREHTYALMEEPATGSVGRVLVADGIFA